MTTSQATADYALGYTDAEQERLIRQATLIAPHTERLFREAGIGVGHRVLDLGSGMGDVSMLVAGLVGASGEVVGIERDATSIERAQARVAAAGLRNVSFLNTDVNNIVTDRPFDAASVVAFMFLPDPTSVLRSFFAWFVLVECLRSRNHRGYRCLPSVTGCPFGLVCFVQSTRLFCGLAQIRKWDSLFLDLSRDRAACAQDASGDTLGSDVDFLRVISGLVCSLLGHASRPTAGDRQDSKWNRVSSARSRCRSRC